MKSCRNCRHFVWGHPNSQLKDVCIDCFYKQDGTPSNWEPMKKTRADRIRAMSDEELAAALYHFGDSPFCRNAKRCWIRTSIYRMRSASAVRCGGCRR